MLCRSLLGQHYLSRWHHLTGQSDREGRLCAGDFSGALGAGCGEEEAAPTLMHHGQHLASPDPLVMLLVRFTCFVSAVIWHFLVSRLCGHFIDFKRRNMNSLHIMESAQGSIRDYDYKLQRFWSLDCFLRVFRWTVPLSRRDTVPLSRRDTVPLRRRDTVPLRRSPGSPSRSASVRLNPDWTPVITTTRCVFLIRSGVSQP